MCRTATGNFRIDTQIDRGNRLLRFAQNTNLNIMNTFFYRKSSKTWILKSLNGKAKHKINFNLTNKLNTVKNAAVLSKLRSSNHKMVRCKSTLDLKRERDNLFKMKKPNLSTDKEESGEWDYNPGQVLTTTKRHEWKQRV